MSFQGYHLGVPSNMLPGMDNKWPEPCYSFFCFWFMLTILHLDLVGYLVERNPGLIWNFLGYVGHI
ncbi:hypothetical protein BC936DRAFT_140042 [Jimgerdemannia flammicorona]|uniref:Uncharacterized protein n=1 Tax=Jimgerdemannia flammicorona TaxID=994334 RepID=A0A433DHA2_9FUNG|nr:hypothetical protein BC936DRAFT_140042 [Jimgerdemannia flammicorona]